MDLLKGILGKIVTGIVALAVLAGAISWFGLSPEQRSDFLQNAGKIAAWAGIVLIFPFATIFVIRRVGCLESNLAGAILVFTYSAAEIIALIGLLGAPPSGGISWLFLTLGALLTTVYNLLICDWLAERFE